MDKSWTPCSNKTPQKGESMLTDALNHIVDGHARSKDTKHPSYNFVRPKYETFSIEYSGIKEGK